MSTERMSDEEIEAIEDRLSHAGLGMEHDPNSIAKLTLKEITTAVLALRQLLAENKRLREENQWRPISEAPINESVLINVPHWDHYGPGIFRAILVDMGNGQSWKTFGWAIGRELPSEMTPTHWRPLPTPPQDGSEE